VQSSPVRRAKEALASLLDVVDSRVSRRACFPVSSVSAGASRFSITGMLFTFVSWGQGIPT